MQSILPEVCIALRMFLCLPVTVAEGERSFSTHSFQTNYLRTTLSQERLKSLALMSIEREIAVEINFDDKSLINLPTKQLERRIFKYYVLFAIIEPLS